MAESVQAVLPFVLSQGVAPVVAKKAKRSPAPVPESSELVMLGCRLPTMRSAKVCVLIVARRGVAVSSPLATKSVSPVSLSSCEKPMPNLTGNPDWPGWNVVAWQRAVAVLTRKSSPSS